MARHNRTGPRKTSERWTERIARQALDALEESGDSLAAFARREGIPAERLYHWRARLRKQAAPVFVEIPRRGSVAPAGGGIFEIVLRSGLSVRVPPDFDAVALRRLVTVLDTEPC